MQGLMFFDIIVIGAILILGLMGLVRGIITEFAGLVGLIGGLVLASRLSSQAGEFIKSNIYNIQNPSMLDFVSFVGVWIVFWILCVLVGKFLSKLVGVSGLGFLDRLGGFVAGSAKVFLTLSAVLAIISNTNLSDEIEEYFKDSKVYPVLLNTGKWIANIDVKALKNDVENAIVPLTKDDSKSDEIIKSEVIMIDNNITSDVNVSKEN
ncbi:MULTISPECIES: CvpA family protein [unclassified Campylobacter]|uniref:CvpA family protein n=1 Tax=unclassified Campylobacter TaxID=2593542 RepID=UPI003D3330FD